MMRIDKFRKMKYKHWNYKVEKSLDETYGKLVLVKKEEPRNASFPHIEYKRARLSKELFMLPDVESYKVFGVNSGDSNSNIKKSYDEIKGKKKLKLKVSALFLKPFLKECIYSEAYRENLLQNSSRSTGCPEERIIFLKLILEPPDKEIIDYSWNEKILQLVWTRVEIENAFSWLSTLGGAYSALGDYFEHCADEAGRISVRQYKLSQMLGDEGLAARSKLYSALAYAQKGKLKIARHIVRNVAEFARSSQDRRLNRMCQGVWAKLKYLRVIQKGTQSPCGGDCGDSNVASPKLF